MDYNTIYNLFMIIYVLAYFALIIYGVTIIIRDIITTKIEKYNIKKHWRLMRKKKINYGLISRGVSQILSMLVALVGFY